MSRGSSGFQQRTRNAIRKYMTLLIYVFYLKNLLTKFCSHVRAPIVFLLEVNRTLQRAALAENCKANDYPLAVQFRQYLI